MCARRFDLELRRYVENEKPVYTKKQRRAFQRLMSGLTVGKSRSERLRFMTLTSSPESLGRNLNADFRTLKMRILRKYHFKMKYWKIRTNEGNGVLHVIYRGKYIPQKWLSAQWADILLFVFFANCDNFGVTRKWGHMLESARNKCGQSVILRHKSIKLGAVIQGDIEKERIFEYAFGRNGELCDFAFNACFNITYSVLDSFK